MPIATIQDILNRWVPQDDAPEATDPLLITLLEDAIDLIESKFPSIEDRIADGSLKASVPKGVITRMIQRAFNSDFSGRASYGYSAGGFSEQGSYASTSTSQQGLYLTDQDIEALRASGAAPAFAINLDKNRPRYYPWSIFGVHPNAGGEWTGRN